MFPGNPDPIAFPPGTGGGCVHSGPFSDMVVHLGPVVLPNYGPPGNFTMQENPYLDNPRCLKRDLNGHFTRAFSSFRNTTNVLLASPTYRDFDILLEADTRFITNDIGIHGGGHFTIGGDPGGDAFISPGDPAFYLHHAQVDRIYWIWQQLDFANRENDIWGTHTMLDMPPSANVTIDDVLDMGHLNEQVAIRDVMNTLSGTPLCYVYV